MFMLLFNYLDTHPKLYHNLKLFKFPLKLYTLKLFPSQIVHFIYIYLSNCQIVRFKFVSLSICSLYHNMTGPLVQGWGVVRGAIIESWWCAVCVCVCVCVRVCVWGCVCERVCLWGVCVCTRCYDINPTWYHRIQRRKTHTGESLRNVSK